MKICKLVVKEINLKGCAISEKAIDHLIECETCSNLYQSQQKVNSLFSLSSEIDVPLTLKSDIIKACELHEINKTSSSIYALIIRIAAVLLLVISGFWLGVYAVNDDNLNESKEIDLFKTHPYKMAVESVPLQNIGRIYFTMTEGGKNESKT